MEKIIESEKMELTKELKEIRRAYDEAEAKRYHIENEEELAKKALRDYQRDIDRDNSKRQRCKHKVRWRKTKLGTTNREGKAIIYTNLHKRDYPKNGKCELCNEKSYKKRDLDYHHWYKNNPSKGLWVCFGCHQLVEQCDKGNIHLVQRYFSLKKQINREFKSDLAPEQVRQAYEEAAR